jgi:hypothetical protein
MFTLLDDVDELDGLELEGELALELVLELAVVLELLDEHAASRRAAPTAVIPNATRTARGLGLPYLSGLPSSLKRFMRPRIHHTGFDRTTPGHRVDLAIRIVNSRAGQITSRSGQLSPGTHSQPRKVVASPHSHAANRTSIQRSWIFIALIDSINACDCDAQVVAGHSQRLPMLISAHIVNKLGRI